MSKILVVEDDRNSARVAEVLTDAGHKVQRIPEPSTLIGAQTAAAMMKVGVLLGAVHSSPWSGGRYRGPAPKPEGHKNLRADRKKERRNRRKGRR